MRSPTTGTGEYTEAVLGEDDGNLVLKFGDGTSDERVVWESGVVSESIHSGPFRLMVQSDGNLVLYSSSRTGGRPTDKNPNAVWSTRTNRTKNDLLAKVWVNLSNGRLVLYHMHHLRKVDSPRGPHESEQKIITWRNTSQVGTTPETPKGDIVLEKRYRIGFNPELKEEDESVKFKLRGDISSLRGALSAEVVPYAPIEEVDGDTCNCDSKIECIHLRFDAAQEATVEKDGRVWTPLHSQIMAANDPRAEYLHAACSEQKRTYFWFVVQGRIQFNGEYTVLAAENKKHKAYAYQNGRVHGTSKLVIGNSTTIPTCDEWLAVEVKKPSASAETVSTALSNKHNCCYWLVVESVEPSTHSCFGYAKKWVVGTFTIYCCLNGVVCNTGKDEYDRDVPWGGVGAKIYPKR